MSVSFSATNRGPAAAAGNRAALLAAARQLFADQGYRVPLNAIARRAGVGQGSLYRHFPTRLDLALAIFEDNYAELEALAASDHGAGGFHRVWQRLLELMLDSVAFIEVAVDAREELAATGLGDRLRRILDEPLSRAQAAGEVDGGLSVEQLGLVLRMAYGVLVTEPDRAQAREAVRRAVALVDPALTMQHRADREDPT
ncbi:MAG: TetR/AcrR family transcriptional regulator [Nitriliruptoraceae bacterium]